MADQAEVNFAAAFANTLSQQPVNYPDDFQPPLEGYLKRVPTLPVSSTSNAMLCKDFHQRLLLQLDVPPPPEIRREEELSAGTSRRMQWWPRADHHPRCDRHNHQIRQAPTVLLSVRAAYGHHPSHQITAGR